MSDEVLKLRLQSVCQKKYIQKQFEKHNINCDAKDCGWTTEIEITQLADYINKPCPKCGANVFTTESATTTYLFMSLLASWPIRFLNWACSFFYKKRRFKVHVQNKEFEVTDA